MKNKRIIASLLFVVSMLILIIPVMPHHHHINGLICMKNDLTADCCIPLTNSCTDGCESHASHDRNGSTSQADAASHHHCCCNTDCIFSHFNQKTPTSTDCDFKPDYLWSHILYYEPVFRLLLLPEEKKQEYTTFYLESLHSILANTLCGLRAPPALLA